MDTHRITIVTTFKIGDKSNFQRKKFIEMVIVLNGDTLKSANCSDCAINTTLEYDPQIYFPRFDKDSAESRDGHSYYKTTSSQSSFILLPGYFYDAHGLFHDNKIIRVIPMQDSHPIKYYYMLGYRHPNTSINNIQISCSNGELYLKKHGMLTNSYLTVSSISEGAVTTKFRDANDYNMAFYFWVLKN